LASGGWAAFNLRLNLDVAHLPDEATIGRRLDELMQLQADDQRIFWLTLARLAEMALTLAGDYADHGEFQAAGDLLVNPRQIDVYRRSHNVPVVKRRHCGISVQLAADIGGADPVRWLRRETQFHVRKDALLPCLRQRLADGQRMRADYLADLDRRMCRVADTMAFWMSWQVSGPSDLMARFESADDDSRCFIQSNLCRFDHSRFHGMGAEICERIVSHDVPSQFLR
jgi:hypothetical protein